MAASPADDIALARILAAQKPGLHSAWIFGASVNGLSFVRSLGRRGIPTVLFDSDRFLGAFSSFTTFVQLPPVGEHAHVWVDLLCRAAQKSEKPPVALITSDAHGLLFTEHEASLRPCIRFILPDRQTLDAIVNKRQQYEIARQAGVPIPETHFPESAADLERLASSIRYPCILKPYQSHIGKARIKGRKVVVVSSSDQLRRQYAALEASGVPFMVQEIIPGGDDALYGYLAFWDEAGNEIAWLAKQKLRQNPPLYGDGSLQITTLVPGLPELSRRLLTAFRYRGFVGVEFKKDPRDGLMKLMEINPRTVSGNQMAVSAGIDFPWIGYRNLIGDPIPASEIPAFQANVKYLNEEWDLKAFLALRLQGQLTFTRWLGSIRGARAKAIWAWDDPRPALAVLWRILRAALRWPRRLHAPAELAPSQPSPPLKGAPGTGDR